METPAPLKPKAVPGGLPGGNARSRSYEESDPAESYDLLTTGGARHVWVTTILGRYIREKAESMQEYPNIAPGAEFDGYE